MSLRQEILNEIKSMLKEDQWYSDPQFSKLQSSADDAPDKKGPCVNPGDPGCEEYESTDYSPKSFEQTKAEFLDVTPGLPVVAQCPQNSQAYARIDVGQKLGIDPPNTPICFDGNNKPIAVMGDPKKVTVKKKNKLCRLPEIKTFQKIYNLQMDLDYQGKNKINEDSILGKNTKMAVSFMAGLHNVPDNDVPKTCDRKAYDRFTKYFPSLRKKALNIPDKLAESQSRTKNESKNWLDRTREDTTSSLFERLVKDVSKKKVI